LHAALFENPPPSLQEVATRVGSTSQGLKYRFPETAEEIITRYKAYKYGTDWEVIEECLKNTLSQEVALSLGETSRSIGISVGRLRRRFPDLTAAIASRFEEYVQLQQEARERQLRQEVLEAIISIQEEGLYPYRKRVAERVKVIRDLNEIGRVLRKVRLESETHSVVKS
jgi:AraC-like DNA-binding protein